MAADTGSSGLVHHASDDLADALEAAVSTLHDDDLLAAGQNGGELTLDHIHHLSTSAQPVRSASYHSFEGSDLGSASAYSTAHAMPAVTHIGDVIPIPRPASTSSSIGDARRPSAAGDDEADSAVTPVSKAPGRRTPTRQAPAPGMSSRGSSTPGGEGAAAGGGRNKLPRVALLAKPPPKREEPASPRSGSTRPNSARGPGSARGSAGPSPAKAGNLVQRSTASESRVSGRGGSRIPRPGGIAVSPPLPEPKAAPVLSSSPPLKPQPSPSRSFGSASPPKQASSPERRSSPQRAPLEAGSSSRALYGSPSPGSGLSPTPSVRSSGYGQRATAARVSARSGARPGGSITKMDTRKQLEDIMKDLQDIKKDLGMPLADPSVAAPPLAQQLGADAAATQEPQPAASAAEPEASATGAAAADAPAEAPASLAAETEAAAAEEGAQAGSTAAASPTAVESEQRVEASAAADGQVEDAAPGGTPAPDGADQETGKEDGAASTAAEEAAAAEDELPTSTAAAYIEGPSLPAKPKAMDTEPAETEAAAKQCCACSIM